MPNQLDNQMEGLGETVARELIDAYCCQDWGMSFVRFSEIFTGHMLDTIGNLQVEMEEEE